MNRLTNLRGGGFIACNGCFEPQCTNCKEFKKQASRLAEYENTGLEPDETLTGLELASIYTLLEDAKQYQKLKLEGRLIELPCKVGENAWLLLERSDNGKSRIIKSHCTKYLQDITRNNTCGIWSFYFDCQEIGNRLEYYIKDFGNKVFTTLTEAENALEVLNNV